MPAFYRKAAANGVSPVNQHRRKTIMCKFNHLILTQFNVKIESNAKIKESPEWLCSRFGLFDRFCYPSMRAQTNQNFRWLVFFDAQTPDIFQERIRSYSRWGNFIPCYVDSFSNLENHDIINENIAPSSKYLITTRIDNDDAISTTFVDEVQKNFCGQRFEFINFANGYLLDINNHRLYKKKISSNMFVSLIERIENFKTVFCGLPSSIVLPPKHGRGQLSLESFRTGKDITPQNTPWLSHANLHLVGKIREIETEPLWLLVVHGGNLANQIGISLRVPMQFLENKFSINYAHDPDRGNFIVSNMIKKIGLSFPKPMKSLLRKLYFILGRL